MVMSAMIVSFLFYLWFSYFGGVEPQGVYWDLSLAPYVHVTVDLYTFPICTYHFTCLCTRPPDSNKYEALRSAGFMRFSWG